MTKHEIEKRASKAMDRIAKEHLGLETLETRKSDGLDFSDQAVWSLKAALEAAFHAGLAAGVEKSTDAELADERLRTERH